jgi:acetyltransferase-like isoleucine patch superfamily enzyme
MSALRKRWQIFRNPRATIRFGVGVQAGPGFKVHAPWGGTLVVGNNVEFRRNTLFELWGPDTTVSIGDACHFTYDVVVQCGTRITIEEDVNVGQACMIVDGSHRFRDVDTPFLDQGFDFRPVTIGKGAVIHTKVTVINNIGERAIIGANAVVTKPIPPYTVAVGIPATVVEHFGPKLETAEKPEQRAGNEMDGMS